MRSENAQRNYRRQRVLKDGKIVSSDMHRVFNVKIRDMSASGARVQMAENIALPDSFSLLLVSEGLLYPAVARWRKGKAMGIEFVGDDLATPRREAGTQTLGMFAGCKPGSRRPPLSYAHIFRHSIHAKTYCKFIIPNNNPSSQRPGYAEAKLQLRQGEKSGPRLSACLLVASLGPGIRRDDGKKNEFSTLIIAKMAAKMCESNSDVRRGDGRLALEPPDFVQRGQTSGTNSMAIAKIIKVSGNPTLKKSARRYFPGP